MCWKKVVSLCLFLLPTVNVLKADFFKWDVVVYAEGYGLAHEIFAIQDEGVVWEQGDWRCEVGDFWTTITSELLLEGKTLRCRQEEVQHLVTVTCDLNNRGRQHNFFKEQLPQTNTGFYLEPEDKIGSTYLRLRCYF
jgi:hypothetical protein